MVDKEILADIIDTLKEKEWLEEMIENVTKNDSLIQINFYEQYSDKNVGQYVVRNTALKSVMLDKVHAYLQSELKRVQNQLDRYDIIQTPLQ